MSSGGSCVAQWQQCGGTGWKGATTCCGDGAQCFQQNDYYSQCTLSCPRSWPCEKQAGSDGVSRPGAGTTGTAGQMHTLSPSGQPHTAVATGQSAAPKPKINGTCAFRFGTAFQGPDKEYNNVDYLTVWIGQENDNKKASPLDFGDGEAPLPMVEFNMYWCAVSAAAAAAAAALPPLPPCRRCRRPEPEWRRAQD
jgi:hypothetical protein